MNKKDGKSKTIYHLNKDVPSDKAYANARKKEGIDVKWEATPTWNVISFNQPIESTNDYKLFTEKSDKQDDE